MSQQATPRPWKKHDRLIYAPGEQGGMICELSEPRASMLVEHRRLEMGSPDWEEAHANGEFLVRAVNSHESLLAACEAAERLLDPSRVTQPSFGEHERRNAEVLAQLRAALAAAKKGDPK